MHLLIPEYSEVQILKNDIVLILFLFLMLLKHVVNYSQVRTPIASARRPILQEGLRNILACLHQVPYHRESPLPMELGYNTFRAEIE